VAHSINATTEDRAKWRLQRTKMTHPELHVEVPLAQVLGLGYAEANSILERRQQQKTVQIQRSAPSL